MKLVPLAALASLAIATSPSVAAVPTTGLPASGPQPGEARLIQEIEGDFVAHRSSSGGSCADLWNVLGVAVVDRTVMADTMTAEAIVMLSPKTRVARTGDDTVTSCLGERTQVPDWPVGEARPMKMMYRFVREGPTWKLAQRP